MAFLLCLIWLIWRWFPHASSADADPKPMNLGTVLTDARLAHPEQFEALDWAAWEFQMEDEP